MESPKVYFIKDNKVLKGQLIKQAKRGGWWIRASSFRKDKLISLYKIFDDEQEAKNRLKEIKEYKLNKYNQ